MAKGKFYFGRVVKTGTNYDQKKLVEGLRKAFPIKSKKYSWAFVEVRESNISGQMYISGQLAQYDQDGEIDVVEELTRSRRKSLAKNQIRSSARFVYFPEHSGIIFLNVWNSIPVNVFRSKFCELVDAYYQKMFVQTEIELITDYKKFSTKIRELESVLEIDANVHLPNPMFGELWEEIDRELRERNSERLTIIEKAKSGRSIKTNLIEIVDSIVNGKFKLKKRPSISEAAILMAADGYGKGTVIGSVGTEIVEVRTNKMELTISLEKDCDEETLARVALKALENIEKERRMKHGK